MTLPNYKSGIHMDSCKGDTMLKEQQLKVSGFCGV